MTPQTNQHDIDATPLFLDENSGEFKLTLPGHLASYLNTIAKFHLKEPEDLLLNLIINHLTSEIFSIYKSEFVSGGLNAEN